jgi:hypothetical protein
MIPVATLTAWLDADANDAPLLAELEAQAVAYVQAVTGRYFGPVGSVTEVLRGTGTARLWLAEVPVDGVVTVEEAALPAAAGEAFTAFVVRGAGTEAWLARTDGAPWHPGAEYSVTYARGYPPGAEPADIRRYVQAWVARQWSSRGREGLSSEQVGGHSVAFGKTLSAGEAELEQVVLHWRRRVLA